MSGSHNDTVLAVADAFNVELFSLAEQNSADSYVPLEPLATLDDNTNRAVQIVANVLYVVEQEQLSVYDLSQSPISAESGLPSTLSGLAYRYYNYTSTNLDEAVRPIHRALRYQNGMLYQLSINAVIEFDLGNPLLPVPTRASVFGAGLCTELGLGTCDVLSDSIEARNFTSNSQRLYFIDGLTLSYIDLSDTNFAVNASLFTDVDALDASDAYVFYATDNVLYRIDAMNFAAVDSLNLSSTIRAIRIFGNNCYVIEGRYVHRYDAMQSPMQLVESFETLSPFDVDEKDGFIYIMDGYNGMKVVKLKEFELP